MFCLVATIVFFSFYGPTRGTFPSIANMQAILSGQAVIAVVAGTVFSAISGSTIATTAMLGSLMLPVMLARGYHPTIAAGPIMAIGGAEDKVRERIILARFVAMAGGADAHIAIVPTASSIEDAGQRYKAIFLDLGAASAEVAVVPDRAAAMGKAAVRALDGATGIFMGGGNQMRLATILGGSRVEEAIHARSAAGACTRRVR